MGVATWTKKSKHINDLAERTFFLTKDHIYYKKRLSSKSARGVMSLKFARATFTGEELEENGDLIFKVKLVKNLKFTELFTADKDLFLSWKKLLCRLTIQTDFKKKYQVVR